MKQEVSELLTKAAGKLAPKKWWPRFLIAGVSIFAALALIIFFSAGVYAENYRGRAYPGVSFGKFPVGGLTGTQIRNLMETVNNRLAKEGIELLVSGNKAEKRSVVISTLKGGDASLELAKIDGEQAASLALSIGRQGGFWRQTFSPLWYRLIDSQELAAPLFVREASLIEELKNSLREFEDAPRAAGVRFEGGVLNRPEIVPEKPGLVFDYSELTRFIRQSLEGLSFDPVIATAKPFSPKITASDLRSILPRLKDIFSYGDLGLNHIDPQTKRRRDWVFTTLTLSGYLSGERDENNAPIFALDRDKLIDYLKNFVESEVDLPAQDAKFTIVEGRVKEFQGSRSGVSLDIDKTFDALNAAFVERNYRPAEAPKTISVAVLVTEPKVKTAEVNDLGISEVLGAGVSTFKGSHTNRIKNIANAVKRLNGTLVKPGEVFSANKFVGPYTAENGFLPELVIKGNRILPEVGGGMCQIGTTLFRMAMNSGMDITQRQNHSLVVSYYADPVNGNPGTDATLYEPGLDLKFKNDTGGHILVQAEADFKKQQLIFTLWGKGDGRKGWYTHPLVSKWIPPKAEVQQMLVSDGSVKPGETKCQDSYKGAVASFTYTRVTSAGQKIDRVFESFYRPLPKICLTGATASSTPALGADQDSPGITDVAPRP